MKKNREIEEKIAKLKKNEKLKKKIVKLKKIAKSKKKGKIKRIFFAKINENTEINNLSIKKTERIFAMNYLVRIDRSEMLQCIITLFVVTMQIKIRP